jgi:heat shock protein HslJ
MKKVIMLFFMALFMGGLFACTEVKIDAKKLEGKWSIVEVKGKKLAKEILPNIVFDMKDQKVQGNAGCNIFNSTLVLDESDPSSIIINPGAATMMSCPDMETEEAVLQAMGEVKQVKSGETESEMLLVDAEGNVVMVLSKTN